MVISSRSKVSKALPIAAFGTVAAMAPGPVHDLMLSIPASISPVHDIALGVDPQYASLASIGIIGLTLLGTVRSGPSYSSPNIPKELDYQRRDSERKIWHSA